MNVAHRVQLRLEPLLGLLPGVRSVVSCSEADWERKRRNRQKKFCGSPAEFREELLHIVEVEPLDDRLDGFGVVPQRGIG
jgi:hypothetical protein